MTEPMESGKQLTFFDYLRPVWRFKFPVVLVVALAAVGAYVITNRQARTYQTSTDLYVGQSTLQQAVNPGTGSGTDRQVADQAGLVTTPAVAKLVESNLRLPYPPNALLGAVQASPASGSDFLTITATSGNPTLAAELANGFARAYLELARRNVVRSARAALVTAESQLHAGGSSGATTPAQQALRQEIATIQGVLVSPPSAGQQVTPAAVPAVPTSPKPTRNAIFAAALALVLGVILSYIFDRSDRRLRRLDELEGLFELPVLATMPHVRRAGPTRRNPHGIVEALREPYRTLRVNLDMARAVRGAKVIMVSSALPGEGKSTVVRNLAISYREAGARVAVLEADLRRPVFAEQFNVDPGPGLGDALAHGGELSLQRAPNGNGHGNGSSGRIDVAVAGHVTGDPTALVSEERLRGLISQVGAGYDVVLVDSPPLLSVSDGLPLLGLVDGVLLVIRGGTATRSAAARLRRTIERVNRSQRVHGLGVVANDVVDELATSYYRQNGKRGGSEAAYVSDAPGRAES